MTGFWKSGPGIMEEGERTSLVNDQALVAENVPTKLPVDDHRRTAQSTDPVTIILELSTYTIEEIP
jgi:hypothetical protein